jgi:hypothetical protein
MRTADRPPRVQVRNRRRPAEAEASHVDGEVVVDLGDLDALAERIKQPEVIRMLARLLLASPLPTRRE